MVIGKKIFSYSMISLSVILLAFCVGCAGLIGSAVISGFPTYQDTVESWSDIEEGKGRVIFYFVKQEGSGLIGPSVASLIIDEDRNLRAAFSDRTFIFADLSEGTHTAVFKRGAFKKNLVNEIQIKKGEFLYVKLDKPKESNSDLVMQVVDKDEAINDLVLLHHNFKKPLAIYYQPKPL